MGFGDVYFMLFILFLFAFGTQREHGNGFLVEYGIKIILLCGPGADTGFQKGGGPGNC